MYMLHIYIIIYPYNKYINTHTYVYRIYIYTIIHIYRYITHDLCVKNYVRPPLVFASSNLLNVCVFFYIYIHHYIYHWLYTYSHRFRSFAFLDIPLYTHVSLCMTTHICITFITQCKKCPSPCLQRARTDLMLHNHLVVDWQVQFFTCTVQIDMDAHAHTYLYYIHTQTYTT